MECLFGEVSFFPPLFFYCFFFLSFFLTDAIVNTCYIVTLGSIFLYEFFTFVLAKSMRSLLLIHTSHVELTRLYSDWRNKKKKKKKRKRNCNNNYTESCACNLTCKDRTSTSLHSFTYFVQFFVVVSFFFFSVCFSFSFLSCLSCFLYNCMFSTDDLPTYCCVWACVRARVRSRARARVHSYFDRI